jgi:diphthamide biosynthesis methyltransferase
MGMCENADMCTILTMHRATTHTDLALRARTEGIPVKVIHNASIMNAVAACAAQH